jgi:hypothetical protein
MLAATFSSKESPWAAPDDKRLGLVGNDAWVCPDNRAVPKQERCKTGLGEIAPLLST